MTARRLAVAPCRAIGCFVVASLVMTAGVAQTASATTSTGTTTAPSGSLVQSLLSLVVVVALIYGAAWLLKRVGPRGRGNGLVQVVGGASVGPRERVVVVRYAGETLLLGVAPGQVTLLRTGPDDAASPPIVGAPQPSFVERLRAARGRG